MTFQENVLRLSRQGLSEPEIANRLRAKRATVHRVLKGAQTAEDSVALEDPEDDDETTEGPGVEDDTEEGTPTAIASVRQRTTTVWDPRPPPFPRPPTDLAWYLTRQFQDYKDHAALTGPWDVVIGWKREAERVPALKAEIATLGQQLSAAQAQNVDWRAHFDTWVRSEVEKQAAVRRAELDAAYATELSSLRVDLGREIAVRQGAMTEVGHLRGELNQTKRELQRAQDVSAELNGELNRLADENQRLRAGLDLTLRDLTERDGFTPNARGVRALIDRYSCLVTEQFVENLWAWVGGRRARVAQLGGE